MLMDIDTDKLEKCAVVSTFRPMPGESRPILITKVKAVTLGRTLLPCHSHYYQTAGSLAVIETLTFPNLITFVPQIS